MKAFLAVEWETGMNIYTFDIDSYRFEAEEPVRNTYGRITETPEWRSVILDYPTPVANVIKLRKRQNVRRAWKAFIGFTNRIVGHQKGESSDG